MYLHSTGRIMHTCPRTASVLQSAVTAMGRIRTCGYALARRTMDKDTQRSTHGQLIKLAALRAFTLGRR